jgi:hypothetical protein
VKYPRTQHFNKYSIDNLIGNKLVIEEKMDGSQVGIKFGPGRELFLFSRGHKLDGGHIGEFQFDLFKQWANVKKQELWDILGNRYIMFGEWLYCLHSIYYDLLPHYFLEYDIYDVENDEWWDTDLRHELLEGSGIKSVKVVESFNVSHKNIDAVNIYAMKHQLSYFKSINWKSNLYNAIKNSNQNPESVFKEIDLSDQMEGFYLKIENKDQTISRAKSVRSDFIQTAANSSHWIKRPIIQNKIREGENIWR